jgi:hypothetical protein
MKLWRKAKPAEPLDLTGFVGYWVAVKHGRLIAVGDNPKQIIDRVSGLGPRGNGSTIWYEPRPEEVKHFAVMYPSRPGRVCPNCYFDTREQAERWVEDFAEDYERGYVVTRNGQRDPWRPVGDRA